MDSIIILSSTPYTMRLVNKLLTPLSLVCSVTTGGINIALSLASRKKAYLMIDGKCKGRKRREQYHLGEVSLPVLFL